MIINTTEFVVDDRMKTHLKNSDCCTCEQCLEDIKCLSLNKLPPRYVSSPKGELFSKIDQQMVSQNKMDVEIAVINAIEFVKAHPRHARTS